MINKVILMGRLTRDPELRHTNAGTPVCSFTVAVSSGYGENAQTDFINCVAWNKTAEFVSKYFGKGKMIIVSGRISARSREDRDGKRNYATEVIAFEVSFGESKGQSGEQSNASGNAQSTDSGFVPDTAAESDSGLGGGFVPVDPGDDLPF